MARLSRKFGACTGLRLAASSRTFSYPQCDYKVPECDYKVPGSRFHVPGSGSRFTVHGTLNRNLEPGTWNLEPGTSIIRINHVDKDDERASQEGSQDDCGHRSRPVLWRVCVLDLSGRLSGCQLYRRGARS